MLKIKEYKMKELEKFGFKKFDNYYDNKKYTHTYNIGHSIHKILIDKNRVLHFNVPTISVYDLLFDLIKADMVEKDGE